MAQKRLKQVDEETGEILEDGFIAYIAPKRKNGFQSEGWIAMAQGSTAINMAKSPNLQGQDFRVFMVLMAHLEHENFILTPQADMAEKIGMLPANFSRSLSRLVDEGVIIKGPKIGRVGSYKLNPQYGWKGSAKAHVLALNEQKKERARRMKKAGITGLVKKQKEAENELVPA